MAFENVLNANAKRIKSSSAVELQCTQSIDKIPEYRKNVAPQNYS